MNLLDIVTTSLTPTGTQHAEFFTLLLLFAAFLVISTVLKPKPKIENARPSGLGDFKFPTATEARPVPIVWGTVRQDGPNVTWYGDLRSVAITEKVKTGLFSSSSVTKGYKYFIGVQMVLCRGGTSPVNELRRIWVGDKLLWTGTATADDAAIDINEPSFLGGDEQGSGGIVGRLRFYRGSMTQTANAYLAAGRQVFGGATPKYTGSCYVVWEGGYLGNSSSIGAWSFEVRRIPNGLGLGTPSVNSGNDANPMNVIYEILTNTEWGLGQPAADIDVANFTSVANTLNTEGNGFSFILDGKIECAELLAQIEQQVDGKLILNRSTGKWQFNLARGGYNVNDLTELDETNILEIKSFARTTWSDTSNSVLVKFANREIDYKETYASAQDMANIRIQGNKIVNIEAFYPGVKDAALANVIAWRFLRTASYPLLRADVVTNRVLWNHYEGDVVLFTDPDLGVDRIPMRITKIDLGTLEDGQIAVTLVEDIFQYDDGLFAAPGQTQWVPPPQTVVAIPTTDSLVFEAPKAFCDRDPSAPGVLDRIWAGARYQNDSAARFDITALTAGNYLVAGDVAGFLVAGQLASSITPAGAQGSISLTLNATPDSLPLLVDALQAQVAADDCGSRLSNLIQVGTGASAEFFAFRNVSTSGGQLVLTNGYRALCDTAPRSFASGTNAWILLGSITNRTFPTGSTSIKLVPRSATQALAIGSAPVVSLTMDNRARRPYPPVNMTVNTVSYPSSVSLDVSGAGGPGTGLDDAGFSVAFTRRDFRTVNEVSSVLNESSLLSDFPTANTTQYAVEVRNDPAGANTLLFTTPYQSTSPIEISRTQVLRQTSGVLPSTLRATILTRHTVDSVVYSSAQNVVWDFTATSAALTGAFNWGNRANNSSSSGFTATSTGTHTLNIGTALSTGAVQVSINGGGFTNVITAGGTSGTFSANTGDSIVIRHTQSGAGTSQTLLTMTAGAGVLAYAILTY